jgi:phospholipid/cholesterol/gamma-HCH transport system substrate-binding protein
MNNTQQTFRVGLFFLLGLALAWVTFESLTGGHVFKPKGYMLVAGFANLKGLKNGDEVLMAGVKIGTVESTRLGPQRVEAILNIEPTVKIPKDAIASVQQSSLLGTNHLEVSFGTPGVEPLRDGAEIITKSTVDMNEVIAQLGALGAKLEGVAGDISKALGGGGGEGGGLFQKLDKLVTANSEKVGATMTNLQQVSDKLNKGEGTLGKLVNDPKLHDELLASVNDIKSAAADARTFMANAQAIVDQVKAGKGPLGALVFDEKVSADIRSVTQNLRDVSDKIARGEGTLGKLLNDDSLLKDTRAVLKKADRALDGFDDAGPITAVGVVSRGLF